MLATALATLSLLLLAAAPGETAWLHAGTRCVAGVRGAPRMCVSPATAASASASRTRLIERRTAPMMAFDLLDWLEERLRLRRERRRGTTRVRANRIILVRHGRSEGNENRTAYENTPDSQIALTDVGFAQGVVAGLQIRKLVGNESVRCFYSPYLRARQTLLALLQAFDSQTVQLSSEPRLREQDFGAHPPPLSPAALRTERGPRRRERGGASGPHAVPAPLANRQLPERSADERGARRKADVRPLLLPLPQWRGGDGRLRPHRLADHLPLPHDD